MDPSERQRIGVTDDLLRISCGIENADDLIDDFTRALNRITQAPAAAAQEVRFSSSRT
jgi:cystathionine beta-lyase/cystathionine gamma-synthase